MSEPPGPSQPPPSPFEAPDRFYYPGLDGMRALAFAMVYGFHAHQFDPSAYLANWVELPLIWLVDPLVEGLGGPTVSFRLKHWLTRPFQPNGWAGVQVFFVLSGFLITSLLLRERERFGRVDLRAFWVRRALRIWPLYYLVVALGFGLVPQLNGGITPSSWRATYGAQLPAFLVFLGNWSIIRLGQLPDQVSILWSVCVEEQFYLFVPLLIAFAGPRWRMPFVAALIVAAVAGRYLMAASGIRDVGLRFNSLANLDTLLAGVMLALIAHRRPEVMRPNWAWRLLFVAGCVGIAGFPLCQGGPWRMAFDQVLIWAWAVAMIVLAADPRDRWTAFLRRPSIVWLGQISYGLYVFHEFGLGLIRWLEGRLPSFVPERGLVLILIGMATTVALASASFYGFERPFLRLKRRWTRVPSRPVDDAGDVVSAVP